jgi:thiol:disulfide interchange protein
MPNQLKRSLLAALVILTLASTAGLAQYRNIYSDTANPNTDIAQAIQLATAHHKHIILDFGGNWCGECQVLNIYLHQAPNLDILDKNFILVHIDIGHMDRNTDVAQRYDVPIKRGVPALAVLDSHGRLIYSQKNKEGEAMVRSTDPQTVTAFLNQWKPKS